MGGALAKLGRGRAERDGSGANARAAQSDKTKLLRRGGNVLVLEEDGYYRIENAEDGRCLSVSGNSTIAGTNIFLTEASKTIHQSFALYFDSDVHADYEEADIFSKAYKEENRRKMEEQAEWISGIEDSPTLSRPVQESIYDIGGRKIVHKKGKRGIVIMNGRKMIIQ